MQLARSEFTKAYLAGLPRALIETSLVLVIIVVFVVSVILGDAVDDVVPTLGVFAYVGFRLQPSLQKVVYGLNELRFGAAVLDDLKADHDRIRAERAGRSLAQRSMRPFGATVQLRDVSFAYPGSEHSAVNDINLTIRRGEFIGICGPTGSGKSTIVDIVLGLLPPTSGSVLVDGEELDQDPQGWQSQLAVVSQQVFLTDDTLRQNIAFGQARLDVDEQALLRAVSRAQLLDVVSALPEGLDTPAGERGIRLSGGQRQRVAIARALYREPSIIIFDEGTSALDSVTEAALVAALDELKRGRTLITVAHRISTLRLADRILVIKDGRIVSEGSYEELMTDSELFRSLAR